jgi:hypothetical protein
MYTGKKVYMWKNKWQCLLNWYYIIKVTINKELKKKSGRFITEWNRSASGCADDKEPQNQFHIPLPCNT